MLNLLVERTSNHSKSVHFANPAGDVKTGFKQEKNSEKGEKTTSATVQVADVKLAGSTSKHSKSLDFAAGDVKTRFKQEKKSEKGEKTTSATFRCFSQMLKSCWFNIEACKVERF